MTVTTRGVNSREGGHRPEFSAGVVKLHQIGLESVDIIEEGAGRPRRFNESRGDGTRSYFNSLHRENLPEGNQPYFMSSASHGRAPSENVNRRPGSNSDDSHDVCRRW